MTKKKVKSGKPKAKKAAKKRQAQKKELNPAEVRKNISKLVKSQAQEMAVAVIGSGKQGQLAPVKYLFEMANIFPAPTDGSESTKDEDSLAKTLLERLNVPTTPVVHDEGDEIVIPARRSEDAHETNVVEEKKLEVVDVEGRGEAVLV